MPDFDCYDGETEINAALLSDCLGDLRRLRQDFWYWKKRAVQLDRALATVVHAAGGRISVSFEDAEATLSLRELVFMPEPAGGYSISVEETQGGAGDA